MYLQLTSDSIAKDWARRKPTRDDLHEFVERLVLLSLSPERVSMRTSSGVDLPGWDLILSTSQGNSWVPEGLSLWELGTEDPPKGKAEDDYAKRTIETDEKVRKTSAFMFVTPHRWAGKQKWLDEKTASGDWREVRALDADDLFGWSITCVPAAIWLHRKIFNYSDGVETLEEWWERWSRNPPGVEVTPEILLTSRRAEVTAIQGWLTSNEPYHAVRSSAGEDEAIAFVFAAISDASDNAYALRRALVVSRTEVWGSLVAHEQVPLLLIPNFAGPDSHQAVIHGHAVIEPISRGRSGFADLDLPSRDENEFCSLLEGVGFPSEDARRLAQEAAADLEILKLNWKGVAVSRPTWSQGKAVRFLVPALFVGGWDQSMTGDTEVLARLARLDYSSFEEGLLELVDNGNMPLTRRGNGWRLQRPLEVWGQLRGAVTGEDWDEFVSVAVEVLAAPDPARELPAEERWLAAIKDKRRPHSARLRQGMAQTLAMIASKETFASLPGGRRGGDVATEVVRAILDEANSQPGGDGWAAIRDELPLMAEAAPDALLNALHIGTSGSTPVVKPLFDEHPGFIFSQSDHPHLLWALERLAWSPEYLPAVAVLLARLASMDPGGSHGPRPLETLNEIFFVVRPGTSANQEIRLKALDLLRRVEPDVAWPLLLKLVPDTGQVLTVPSKPEFRDWAEGTDVDVSGPEALKAIEQIIAWLLEDAGSDARHWAELVSIVHDNLLPAATREPVLTALEALDAEQFADADREPMATELRETVGRHTAFPDAKWAMNAEWIERLKGVAERFEPRDPVIRHRWLFEDWPSPERVRGETYEERQNRVDDERREALNDVLDAEGWDGINRLVDVAESPGQVGRALATAPDTEIEAKVLAWAKQDDPRRLLVIDGYSAVKGWKEGWDWTESAARARQADWTSSILARFLLASPEAKRAWLLAAELGTEVEREYWREFRRFPSSEEVWEAVEKLTEFGRPFAAIDLAGARAASKDGQFRPDLAIRALEAAARTGGEGESLTGLTNVQWDVAQLLKSLEEAGTPDSTLATFEWQFLAILEHTEYDARHLQEQLVASPEMFVQIVSLAFISEAQGEAKKAGQPLPETTADEAALARQALKLLMNLRRSPGVAGDGSMDASTLNAWVTEARQRLADADRAAIGDQRIGHALWYAPTGSDSLHPHEAVRDLFEAVASNDMELGFSVEAVNSRGVHARRGQGGDEERELAAEFDRRAAEVESQWPRTGAVLHGIADDYLRWAERWDEDLLDEN